MVKLRESKINDERIKLIKDIVLGIKTIKCYVWGEKYEEKIQNIKKKQSNEIIKYNSVAYLAYGLIQNMGIITFFLIYFISWT